MLLQILYDFGLCFPTIEQNALISKWIDLLLTPLSEWKENIDMAQIAAKDEIIWKFFALFDRFKAKRSNFYTAIKSLIIFSEVVNRLKNFTDIFSNKIFYLKDSTVDPMQMMNRNSKHPYIIAILSSNRKSAKYYIDVHKHLISVCKLFSIL